MIRFRGADETALAAAHCANACHPCSRNVITAAKPSSASAAQACNALEAEKKNAPAVAGGHNVAIAWTAGRAGGEAEEKGSAGDQLSAS